MTYSDEQRGFSLIELLVVMVIIGVLASTALSNFIVWADKSKDTVAQSDYRNLKTVLFDVLTDPDTPNRFVMRRVQGPGGLPSPLDKANISSEVEINIFHQTRVRRNLRPQTTTTMSVEHLEGSKIFQYTEQNGVITEQIVDKP